MKNHKVQLNPNFWQINSLHTCWFERDNTKYWKSRISSWPPSNSNDYQYYWIFLWLLFYDYILMDQEWWVYFFIYLSSCKKEGWRPSENSIRIRMLRYQYLPSFPRPTWLFLRMTRSQCSSAVTWVTQRNRWYNNLWASQNHGLQINHIKLTLGSRLATEIAKLSANCWSGLTVTKSLWHSIIQPILQTKVSKSLRIIVGWV